jgi:hypothetical protein
MECLLWRWSSCGISEDAQCSTPLEDMMGPPRPCDKVRKKAAVFIVAEMKMGQEISYFT